MPTSFLVPILLRMAGPVAFLTAAISAGVANRSVLLIPLLVVAATLTTILVRTISPSPVSDLQSVLQPGEEAPPANPFRGTGRRFAIGLVGYALAFGLAAWIAAIFQTTEFEPQLMMSDTIYLIVPAIVSVIGAWLSARIGLNQMAGMMSQMQDVFAQMQAAQAEQQGANGEDSAFTVDGEIIDPEDDTPDSKPVD